jgi:hypothetical protein
MHQDKDSNGRSDNTVTHIYESHSFADHYTHRKSYCNTNRLSISHSLRRTNAFPNSNTYGDTFRCTNCTAVKCPYRLPDHIITE